MRNSWPVIFSCDVLGYLAYCCDIDNALARSISEWLVFDYV